MLYRAEVSEVFRVICNCGVGIFYGDYQAKRVYALRLAACDYRGYDQLLIGLRLCDAFMSVD